MNTGIITTELSINKRTAMKMAAEHFFKNKRITQVNISAYNVKVVLEYRGKRDNEQEILNQVEIVRFFKKSK